MESKIRKSYSIEEVVWHRWIVDLTLTSWNSAALCSGMQARYFGERDADNFILKFRSVSRWKSKNLYLVLLLLPWFVFCPTVKSNLVDALQAMATKYPQKGPLAAYLQSLYGQLQAMLHSSRIRWSLRLGNYNIRECGSTLYVGMAHTVPPTNTNFRITTNPTSGGSL